MKKLLISSAIAAAMGVAGSASAAVDLDAQTPVAPEFASELDVAGGLTIENGGNAFTFSNALGFGVSNGQTRYVRIDLTNGTFAVAVTADDLNVANGGAAAGTDTGASVAVNQGGAVGDDFVILQITAQDDLGEGEQVQFVTPNIEVENTDGVSVQYRLYETALDATTNLSQSLYSNSGDLIDFASAIIASIESVSPDNIDVTQNSTFFAGGEGDTQTVIGQLLLDVDGDVLGNDGANGLALTDLVGANTVLRLTGDFSTFDQVTYAAGNDCAAGTSIDLTIPAGDDADGELDGSDLLINIGTNDHVNAGEGLFLCATTNGEDVIPETTFAAIYEAQDSAPYSVGTVALGDLSTLEKNGSSAETTLQLAPDGAFSNFVRVTNPSNIEGRVFFQLINDDGESVSFALNDVSVQGTAQPESLVAGASSRLIPMSSLVAAAQAADASFEAASNARNKYRIIVDGEFGDSEDRTGIRIVNVTLANDNSTFSTF